MAREGLMDDIGYDPMPYDDSFLEEVEKKGYDNGYSDGVVEACDLFMKKFCEFHQLNGRVGREDIQTIQRVTQRELIGVRV